MKSKKNIAILVGAGTVIAAAATTTGLVLGLKKEEKKPINMQQAVKEEKEVDDYYRGILQDEQVRINNLKSNGTYVPKPKTLGSKNIGPTSIKDFNQKEAQKYGIDFSGFKPDTFEYKYYFIPSRNAIQIHTKLKEEEHKKFDPSVHAKNISLSNQPKKTPATTNKNKTQDKNALDKEQGIINQISTLSAIILKPNEPIKNEILNESIAKIYGFKNITFDFVRFSYTYSVSETSITIIPEIKDYMLDEVIQPTVTAKPIQVKWKATQDKNLKELDKEQERINKLGSSSEALLNQPAEKDFIKNSDNRLFDEAVAASYQINYDGFDTDKFSYTYFSEGDEGIMIVPHTKDNTGPLLSPEIAPKIIKIFWKEWYGDWASDYKKEAEKDFKSTISWSAVNKKLKETKGSYKSRDVQDILLDKNISGIEFPAIPYGLYVSLIAPFRVIKEKNIVYYAGTIRNSRNHVNRIMFTITYK